MQIWKRLTKRQSSRHVGDEVELESDPSDISSIERGQSPVRGDSRMELLGSPSTIGKGSSFKKVKKGKKVKIEVKEAGDQSFMQIAKGVWDNARCYFVDPDEKRKAYALMFANVVLLGIDNGIMVWFSYFQRDYSTALQQKDQPGFYHGIWKFMLIIACVIPVSCAYSYANGWFNNEWRLYMTNNMTTRYYQNRRFYQMKLVNLGIDNPDQRIAQDVGSFVHSTSSLASAVIDSIITLFSFALVLYSISPKVCVFLIFYAVLGTVVTLKIFGMPLTIIARDCLQEEADFRFSLIRVRENAEAVAFYHGESQERDASLRLFGKFMDTLFRQLRWTVGLSSFKKIYTYFTFMIPPLLIAPAYFRGEVEFGVISQTSFAFRSILSSVTLIVTRMDSLSRLAAQSTRITQMRAALIQADEKGNIQVDELHNPSFALQTQNLSLYTPDGMMRLSHQLNFELPRRTSLIIVGGSGCGKSSMLRCFAGLWRRGEGKVNTLRHSDCTFVPQRTYMTLGTLRAQLCYPLSESESKAKFSDQKLKDALLSLNLRDVCESHKLDAVEDWGMLLSVGQQQRVAVARVLLMQPQMVFLDEATSALDGTNEILVYDLLKKACPTLVSVGHRPALLDLHDMVLWCRDRKSASDTENWELMTRDEYKQKKRDAGYDTVM